MLLGPIFSLELITTARRGRYYLVRILYALVLLLMLAITYQSSHLRRPFAGIHGVANVARDFFGVFSVLQVLAILLLGPAMVAGTIAQERERRTIEYLFTSQLSNADIVLGKLAARLLGIAFLLAAGIPVLALAMLLGGIPPAAMLGLSLLTLETLLVVGSLSIAVSVSRRRTRDAVISAYVLLAAVLILPVIGSTLRYVPPGGFLGVVADWISTACEPIANLNPFAVLQQMQRPPAGESLVLRLLKIFAAYAGFSAACLALAVGTVRRSYARSEGRGSGPRRFRWPAWRPKVWERSLLWKEMFVEPAIGRLGWLGRAAFALLLVSTLASWMLMVYQLSRGGGQPRELMLSTIVSVCYLQCFGLLLAAARAATAVSSEKERDCWVMLLSTPLSGATIVGGKLMGNLYAVRWIAAPVLVLWILAGIVEPEFIPAIPVQLATWCLLLVYASCLGVAFSLWCRSSLRAMAATVGLGAFIGGLYLPFAFLLLEFILLAGSGPHDSQWLILIPCIPFLLAFPALGWEGYIASGHMDRGGGELLGAYVFGMIGYFCVTAVLWQGMVNRFGQLAGRMPESAEAEKPPAAS